MNKLLSLLILSGSFHYANAQTKPAPTTKPAATAKPPVPAKPARPAFKAPIDSVSYAIGMLDGAFFKQQGLTNINGQLLGQGFTDVLNGQAALTPEQADQVIRRQLQAMARKKIQPNIDAGQKFMAENAKRPGVKQTASGLQYEVIKQGDGPRPSDTSVVKVHYDGMLLNGTKFDSSRDRGEPLTYPANQFIRGWVEGLQLMNTGSRYKLWIPYNLAYGEQGSGEKIPGGSTLVFDMELLEIVK
jgi:FKBP-type peptidyl-prolyl cis-trans isomerase